MQRGAGRDTGLVGDACEIEIIVGIEIIAGDGFAEPQLEIIAYPEHAVDRLGLPEHAGRTGILDSADDRRCLMDIARTVPAEGHGTQVVLLLDRVFLAVETEGHDASVLDHGFVAGCLIIEAVLGIERHGGYPHLLGFFGELVLECRRSRQGDNSRSSLAARGCSLPSSDAAYRSAHRWTAG